MNKEEDFSKMIKDHEGIIYKITRVFVIRKKIRGIYIKILYINYGKGLTLLKVILNAVLGCTKSRLIQHILS